MKCPHCGARVKREEYFCPNCGEKLEFRNQVYPVLKYSIINAALFTLLVPLAISLLFELLHIPFLYAMLLGWLPGAAVAGYILREYYVLAKEGKYSALKGIFATLINCAVIVFALMMTLVIAFEFAHMRSAKKQIISQDYSIAHMVADVDNDLYYFEDEDGIYYCYDLETNIVCDSDKDEYETVVELADDNNGSSYYIMK